MRQGVLLPACFSILLVCVALPPGFAVAEECMTAEAIERINRLTKNSRLFERDGLEAKIFLALDPRLLRFENAYERLLAQDVDKLIVWKIRRNSRLVAAVPFANGCAAEGYGEFDQSERIELMRRALDAITRKGVDDSSVKAAIEKLVRFEFGKADPALVEKTFDKVRQLLEPAAPAPDPIRPEK